VKYKYILRRMNGMTIKFDERQYNELLVNWDSSVDNFKLWTIIVCGIKEDSKLYIRIDELIKTTDDLNLWIDCFDGNIDEIDLVTEEYESLISDYPHVATG
jgi:hypothetical protein